MLYKYIKAPAEEEKIYEKRVVAPPKSKKPKKTKKPSHLVKKFGKFIPPTMITLGSLLIANVAWPIISHELIFSPQIRREPILSPLQDGGYIQTIPSSRENDPSTPQVLGSAIDYTKPGNWFPTADYQAGSSYQVQEYIVSIPKVGVEDARVVIGGESLDDGLIHFPGTSLPGQLGSPVIFGHSILRQFYAPQISNSDRYESIFSKIMTLKDDDEIIVEYDGITYTYLVKEKVEVQPEDIFILQQRLNNRELKLITCTPEGTYLRRGVIIAELVEVF